MVKAGRSKSGKGGKGKGPASDRSGSGPPSPTRRLKKGGKRGRRLCHMDGCALCPSFGFEGEVAVSCSHHKEPGMRNLTARRCQHEGCFTVANFGMPGDKPGYCAAHSTAGMVNRNKPRGAEGMLAGVGIARSSRRAAKANTVLQGLRLGGARGGGLGVGGASASDAVTTRSSYHRAHYAVSPGTGSGSSGEVGDGDGSSSVHGVLDAQAKLHSSGDRSNGRSRMSFGEDSGDGVGVDEGRVESDRDSGLSINGGKAKGNSSQHRMRAAGTSAPTTDPSTFFISRGDDPPEPDIVPYRGNQSKRADLSRGPGGAGCLRVRSGGAVAMTASMQNLHNPGAAAAQEAYLAAHRGGLKAAQMGQAVDSIMHRVGTSRGGIDAGFPGDLRGGSGMMGGNKDMGLVGGDLIHSPAVDGNLDGPLIMDMSNGLDGLLGTEHHLNVDVVKDGAAAGEELVRTPRGINLARALRGSQELSCSSRAASFLSNGEHSRGIGCRRESDALSLSEGEGGEDFGGLVNLQGLDSIGLASLGNPAPGGEALSRALASSAATSGSISISTSGCMGLTSLGVMSAGAIVSIAPSPSLQASSAGMLTPSEGTQSLAAFSTALTASSTPLSEAPVSTPAALPVAGGVMPTDEGEGWWDGFEGEEYVAMPEPMWGVDLGNAGLAHDPSGRGQDDSRAWRQGAPSGPLPLARGASVACLTGPLGGGGGGGDNDAVVGKDSKDSLQGMLLDHPNQLKPRGLLCSSPSLVGDGFGMEDVGFSTVQETKGRGDRVGCGSGGGGGALDPPGFPLLSGGSGRLSGERDELGDVEGVRLSPMKRRQRFPSVGERENLRFYRTDA